MNTYAVDFETYYDSECSIKTLGPRGYFSHPLFEAYLVTVVGDDGYSYAGHPKDFDWSLLDGQTVLSHNASFDESLYLFGAQVGWFGPCAPAVWHCTADLCAFLGHPRSLKEASGAVLGIEVSKDVRDNMKGKRWENMTEEFRKEVMEYAIKDSQLCLSLWKQLSAKWPSTERAISQLNRRACRRGLPIDSSALQKNLESIKVQLFESEQSIPWIADSTPLSRKAFNEQCRIQGIQPPSSLAADSEEADEWFAAHLEACPWARAVQNFRRLNTFIKKLQAFDYGTMPDGRYYGGLMYCGANPTARFSGSGGNLNLQNLPRGEVFGVDFRQMIRAKEGHKLLVADLSQIEIRTLFWWAKDTKALNLIRESDDIYEAIAVLLNLWDPSKGESFAAQKEFRQRVKAMALGCQFGLSAKGFASYSGIPLDQAEAAVTQYRSKMGKVVDYWNDLKRQVSVCSATNREMTITLPSGRTMNYGVPRRVSSTMPDGNPRIGYVGKMVRNGKRRDFRLWHGLLAENSAQALARDIFCDMLLRIEAAGIPIIFHVHDEVVCEVKEETAEQDLATVLDIMSTPPKWIDEIPLGASGHLCDFYSKG